MFVPQKMRDQLLEAVEDGGNKALDELVLLAMASSEIEEFVAAFIALSGWGERGFRAIVDIALKRGRVAPKTTAFMMLSNIAVVGRVWRGILGHQTGDLPNLIDRKLAQMPASLLANKALNALIMELPTDDLFSPLSNAMMFLSIGDAHVADGLMAALSTRWFRFGPAAVDEFERLVADKADDEPSFQAFLCSHPQLLDPMAVQVWSQPNFHGGFEPDFVIKRADNSYLVVEIECPSKMLMTKSGQLSSQAIHAEKQALDYEDFLSQRVLEARNHFPDFNRAECLVVIGLEAKLSEPQRRGLQMANTKRQDVRIVGFDWLLNRAMAVIDNVGQGEIKVVQRHRMI